MLRTFARHRVLTQRQLQRSLHISLYASVLPVRREGLDSFVRNVHASFTSASREGGDSSGEKPSTEQPGVRVTFDLSGCEDYVSKSAKLKKEAWPWWLQLVSEMRSEPHTARFLDLARGWPGWQDFTKEAGASASGVNSGAAHGSDPQAQPSSAWDAQKVAPSLYRAFLQEFQSPTQGSVGSLVKRLVDKAHKHEHQRLTQELDEKEQLLQEQESQLDAMTADRDKWMMDHQQLVASARQQGKMTEAQLRAAASVASKRADDEALYAHQKMTQLQQQLSSQQEPKDKGPAANPGPTPPTVPTPVGVGSEPSMDGQDALHKLQSVQADSAQLVKLVAENMAELLAQHPQVTHLIGRELSIVKQLAQLISAQLEVIPADLRHFMDLHHRVVESCQLMEDELDEVEQRCADAERDLEEVSLILAKQVSQAKAKAKIDNEGADHSDFANSDEVNRLRDENQELSDQVDELSLDLKQYTRLYRRGEYRGLDGSCEPLAAELEQPERDHHDEVSGLSLGQQKVEDLCSLLREAQLEYDQCAQFTGIPRAAEPVCSDDESLVFEDDASPIAATGQDDDTDPDVWIVSGSGDSSGAESADFDETDSETELEPAETLADGTIGLAISESVYTTLKAGMPEIGTSASQERQLKERVRTMGLCSHRWADSQDHLQQAVDRHLRMVNLAQVLDDAQTHLAELKASIDVEGANADIDAAKRLEEIGSYASEEAAVELRDYVVGMYRSRTCGKDRR